MFGIKRWGRWKRIARSIILYPYPLVHPVYKANICISRHLTQHGLKFRPTTLNVIRPSTCGSIWYVYLGGHLRVDLVGTVYFQCKAFPHSLHKLPAFDTIWDDKSHWWHIRFQTFNQENVNQDPTCKAQFWSSIGSLWQPWWGWWGL